MAFHERGMGMQFLKTLFWVVLAVGLVLFASVNWVPVTVTLWGGLQADVKLPVLVLVAFLIGFLPMFVLHRTRMWSIRRRAETQERLNVGNLPAPPASPAPSRPVSNEGRIATDSKAWPAP
jgi:lipopolysaccharide assembly protein A